MPVARVQQRPKRSGDHFVQTCYAQVALSEGHFMQTCYAQERSASVGAKPMSTGHRAPYADSQQGTLHFPCRAKGTRDPLVYFVFRHTPKGGLYLNAKS